VDVNGDGVVSLAEFQGMFAERREEAGQEAWATFLGFLRQFPDMAETIEQAFDAADLDGNGYLDTGELAGMLVGCGVALDGLQLRLVRDELDANKDGRVSLREFARAVERRAAELDRLEHAEAQAHQGSNAAGTSAQSDGDHHATRAGNHFLGSSVSADPGGYDEEELSESY
jgi:hypothetical protein